MQEQIAQQATQEHINMNLSVFYDERGNLYVVDIIVAPAEYTPVIIEIP